jgi:hypothetical protein
MEQEMSVLCGNSKNNVHGRVVILVRPEEKSESEESGRIGKYWRKIVWRWLDTKIFQKIHIHVVELELRTTFTRYDNKGDTRVPEDNGQLFLEEAGGTSPQTK